MLRHSCYITDNTCIFLILNFRPVLNVVCFLLGNSPALNFVCQLFETLCSIFIRGYENGTEFSETSAYKVQTAKNCPEKSILQDMYMSPVHCNTDTHCDTFLLSSLVLQSRSPARSARSLFGRYLISATLLGQFPSV